MSIEGQPSSERQGIEGLRVDILSGGISHERDVSLRSGRRVADVLFRAGARVRVLEPDKGLLPALEVDRPDVVWPLLHGAGGENGALYSVLKASGYGYVGSPAGAASLAWSKASAKTLVARAGLRTPPAVVLTSSVFRELGADAVIGSVMRDVALPVVVKPVEGGSAQGVTHVASRGELPHALITAFAYGDVVLIEQKIVGQEIPVTVVELGDGEEPIAVPVEIVPTSETYDYEARYTAGETTYFAPARVSEEVDERLRAVARRIVEVLGLTDITRIDLIVDEAGEVWFTDAAAVPGLTETSVVPLAITTAGYGLADVYSRLVLRAAARSRPE